MNSAEIDLARISHQLALAAMQAAATYNQAQEQLDLARLLDADRLTATEGLALSRKTVAELKTLTFEHKEIFFKFITDATAQLMAAANEIGEERRLEFTQSLMASINRNLASQSKFYEGRECWITAASRVLDLADQNLGEIWLEDGSLVFASNDLLEDFCAIVAEMDKVRDDEVALLEERQTHIAASFASANYKR